MTREEAIRILASSCIPGSKQTEALETLIPELAESEDERIRKFLVDFFASYKIGDAETKLNGVRIDDILAYLEKQKEQKPAESISQLTVQGKGVYKICPRCKERMVRDDSMVYTSMPPQYRYECPKCGESECDTFMYDNPETDEQKPAEWSEEDEIMLKWIEDILLIADDDLNDKLNGKVNPITDSAYSSMKLCIAKCRSWLKARRPSWKPSEEQMEALDKAIPVCMGVVGRDEIVPLESLYEQLKKLINIKSEGIV